MPAQVTVTVTGAGETVRYVSPSGNNGNDGLTPGTAWETLDFAFAQLQPGHVLEAAGGVYRYPSSTLSTAALVGTASEPITVRSAAGQVAVIDGAWAAFQSPGAWEPDPGAPAGTEVWRTVASNYPSGLWRGGFIHPTTGRPVRLLTYHSGNGGLNALRATQYAWVLSKEYYRGPGVAFSGGRLFVRLQNLESPRNGGIPSACPAGHPARTTPPSSFGFNPNNYKINVSPEHDLIDLAGQHVRWERVAFENADRIFVANGHHHHFDRCRVWTYQVGIRAGGTSHHITFDRCDIDAGHPHYISWVEVKASNPDFQTDPDQKNAIATFDGGAHDYGWTDSFFGSHFDGLTLASNDIFGITFRNNFLDFIFDDGMQLNGGVSHVDIAFSYFHGPGPGHNGGVITGKDPSHFNTRFVHHNVINAWRNGEGEFGTRNPIDWSGAGWRTGGHMAFPTHSASGQIGPWIAYNNTVIIGDAHNNQGAGFSRPGIFTAGHKHYWHKNIVLQMEQREVERGVPIDPSDTSQDHNVYWQEVLGFPLLNDWGGDHDTLAGYYLSQHFQDTKASYPPGYEANSKQADPALLDADNLDFRPAPAGAAATGAPDISGTGYPDADATTYYGAVDPAAATGLGAVGPRFSYGP